MRKVVASTVVVLLAVSCTGARQRTDPGDGSDPGAGSPPARSVLRPGEPLLPPAEATVLEGLPIDVVIGEEDLDPELVEVVDSGPQQVVLYGDPSARDPFERPWVLAVLQQRSGDVGLGGRFERHDTDTTWTEVPLLELRARSRVAGLVSSGLDRGEAEALASAAVVTGGADEPASISLPAPSLAEVGAELVPIASGGLDVIALAGARDRSRLAPMVRWVDRTDPWLQTPRLVVTSYGADRGLELLVRATNGGRSVGPSIVPIESPWPGDVVVGVRTLAGTTAVVQAAGIDSDEVSAVLDQLRPADGGRVDELRSAIVTRPPTTQPIHMGPALLLHGRALDGAYAYQTAAYTLDSPALCGARLMVTYPDGDRDEGSTPSGVRCAELGSVGVVGLRGGRGTAVHGELPGEVTDVTVTFDDGEVVEPMVERAGRSAFVLVAEGRRTVAAIEARRADGSVLARLPAPLSSAPLGHDEDERAVRLVAPP